MMRMHADEEDLLNQQNTYDPGGEDDPAGEEPVEPAEGEDPELAAERGPGARSADPRQQKMFDTIVKQALQALTTPSGARTLFLAAQQSGDAAQAIAQLAQKALEGVQQAAGAAGVELDPAAVQAATQPVVAVMAKLCQEGGLTPDAGQTTQDALAMLGGGDGAAQ